MWHYVDSLQTFGPVSLEYLEQRVKSGLLKASDKVWCEGMVEWVIAAKVPELFPHAKSTPPPIPSEERLAPPAPAVSARSSPPEIPRPPNGTRTQYRAADFKELYTKFMLKYLAVVSLTVAFSFIVVINPRIAVDHLPAFIVASISGAILLTVLSGIFLYRAWAQIQDGRARTTPGKAVGFRFIPFYSLYWEFVAVKGLAEDLQDYARARRIAVDPIARSLTVSYCVLVIVAGVLGGIPILGPLLLIALAAVLLLLFKKIADASAAIAEAKHQASPAAGARPKEDGTVQGAVAVVAAMSAGLGIVEKVFDKGDH